ncbi:MAG: DUF1223 domain-containing protein [Gammaproteobacteria bacterium]|nr:DUF1223 domain-containing protein [Gammaproteobacteria bacterium]
MKNLLILIFIFSLPLSASETITVNSKSGKTAVVELYTSEGCSSCPPADQWFEALIETASDELDVLALAFHVDYWDYIGWKDRFANPKYTSRQRQLGANNKQSSIYTPEFFVSGVETRGTYRVLDEIHQTNDMHAEVDLELTVTHNGNGLLLELMPSSDIHDTNGLHYRYFVYEKNLVSEVTRGENSGETLKHQHVVRYMSPARKLTPTSSLVIAIDPAWKLDDIGVAALVTTPGNLSYLQAVYTSIQALLD